MKILAKNAVKAIVIILVVVGLFFLITKGFSITDIENVDLLKERLEGFGLLAPVVYILLMSAQSQACHWMLPRALSGVLF